MKRVVFAVPGRLDTPTGGYAYDRRIIAELCALGWDAGHLDIGEGFPAPDAGTRATARARLLSIGEGRSVVLDGLALGVLPDEAAELARSHDLVALVHHPLALETGVTAERARILRDSERKALSHVRHIVVTSPSTAQILTSDYGVAPDKVTVARPGSEAPPPSPRGRNAVSRLLCVGSIVPRKGHDVLVAALARLTDLRWHLTIVGDLTRDRDAAARLQQAIAANGLTDRITLEGSVTDAKLAALYTGADLFVLASRFEGYGMAYAEALAHGLAVIGTSAGAIPDTVPPGAGILVPPDDVAALAAAMRSVLDDPERQRALSDAARAAARKLPTWRDSAVIFARVLEGVA